MPDPASPPRTPGPDVAASPQVVLASLLPVALPLLVTLIQALLWDVIAPYAWLGFLPAVALSGALCGLRSGALATLLSVGGAEWLLTLDRAPAERDQDAVVYSTFLFTLLAAASLLAVEGARRAEERLHQAIRGFARQFRGNAGIEATAPEGWNPWTRTAVADAALLQALSRELGWRAAALAALDLPVACFARDGVCLLANPAFAQATGVSLTQWSGRNLLDGPGLSGVDLVAPLTRLLAGHPDGHRERVVLANGCEGWLSWVTDGPAGFVLCTLVPPAGLEAGMHGSLPWAGKAERLPSVRSDNVFALPPRPPASAAALAAESVGSAPRSVVLPPTPAPDPGGASGEALRSVRELRCLVVDDQPLNRELLREILQLEGAQVSCAASGRDAIALVLEDPSAFDVVLMDLQMPGMDGYTAAQVIRREVASERLPILAITADGPGVPQARVRESGMQGVLHKPLDIERLLSLLARVRATPGSSP